MPIFTLGEKALEQQSAQSDVVNFGKQYAVSDPSWLQAFDIAHSCMPLSQNIEQLFRSAWRMQLEPKEFLRQLGFCRLNLASLMAAAEIKVEGELDYKTVEQAINYLGVRYSTVVLAVNYTCEIIEKTSPPQLWSEILDEMIRTIAIGYKIGAKTPVIGMEGGMLMGFVRGVGLGLLMAKDKKAFLNWYSLSGGYEGKRLLHESFGCEPYQVAAAAVQYLGFGPEVAVGAALGMGSLCTSEITLTDEIKAWKAAFQWIEALRVGKSFPDDLESRNFFAELRPDQTTGGPNHTLEILYTEIANLKRQGLQWRWHLMRQ